VALVAYPGESPILDGTCPTTFDECNSPEDPGRIWALLMLWGQWIRIEGLTFDNVHKWNLTVASSHTCIVNNTFIGSYGSDSDSMKSFGGSGPHVIVRGNDFHTAYEQAIDGTEARSWLIEDNDFHDAPDRGVGFKYGANGNVVRNNRFRNLGGHAVSLGGGSSAHNFTFEAANLVMENNTVTNMGIAMVEIFACDGCVVRDNTLDGARFAINLYGDEDPSGCPGGCPLSTDLLITGNRFRNMRGDPDNPDPEAVVPLNAFQVMRAPALPGFTSGDNLYCLIAGADALFAIDNAPVDFDTWKATTGTDATSILSPDTSTECTVW
jgi:hypothetical protein